MAKKVAEEQCDDPRIKALAQLEGVDPEDITDNGDNEYVVGSKSSGRYYFVLTDKEADEKAEEIIAEELWAFKADFIEHETGIRGLGALLEVAQEKSSERLNDPISDIVKKHLRHKEIRRRCRFCRWPWSFYCPV